MEAFLKIVFFIAFLLIYVLAFLLLRPFRLHRKRKISTISLKLSYLIYFAILLIYVFFIIFFKEEETEFESQYEDMKTIMIYVATLLAIFIPNAAIMIRRKFNKKRVEYNYVFTVINLLTVIFFVVLFYFHDWAI